MALVHSESVFDTRAENTRREGLRKGGDEGFVGGGEFYEAGEVSCYCIEGGDICEAELA